MNLFVSLDFIKEGKPMYRETLLGVALAGALDELRPSLQLTDEQCKIIWQEFDRSYDEVLREAPPKTKIQVSSSSVTGGSSAVVEGSNLQSSMNADAIPADGTPAASSGEVRVELVSPSVQFPVYRVVDGIWTIVLKDVEVKVDGGHGNVEKIKLDYLKCFLKDGYTTQKPLKVRRKE